MGSGDANAVQACGSIKGEPRPAAEKVPSAL